MAVFSLDLTDSERDALLDLLRNQGPGSHNPDACAALFMKLQIAEARDGFDLPKIEDDEICESCQ
nr:hypothetical protein [Hyphomonas sp. Mor2]